MAKQTGLHLIKGKVGEYSYYRSAGVSAPLMRRINQGMSARVKNGDEYANTRLNNAEFKNAQGLATFLFNAVPNRKASMMRRFAIAEMTKRGLEYIKDGSGNWGARVPAATMDGIAVDLLENRAKSGPYQGEYGMLSFEKSGNSIVIHLAATEESSTALVDKGIDGYYALVVRGALAEVVVDGFVRQHFGVSSINPHPVTVDPTDPEESDISTFIPGPATLGMSPAGFTAAQGADNNGMYAIVSFLPYRQVGSQRHTLYEYATFACLNLGAIPTE
jgi:hypothetical protein